MTRQPENVLAGWYFVDPEALEAALLKCTSELDTLPAIPQYEDVRPAEIVAKGIVSCQCTRLELGESVIGFVTGGERAKRTLNAQGVPPPPLDSSFDAPGDARK